MGFWSDVVNGAVTGAVSTAVKPTLPLVCGQAGWMVDADLGDGKYELRFNGGAFGQRSVLVNWGRTVASFAVRSAAEFTAERLPHQIGWGLLMRNKDMSLGAWDMREMNSGRIGFVVSYTAIIGGIDAAFLKLICEGLIEEVTEVDRGLRSKGLV